MKLTKRRILLARGNRDVLGSTVIFLLCAMLIALLPGRAAAVDAAEVMRVSDHQFAALQIESDVDDEMLFGDSPLHETRGGSAQPYVGPADTRTELLSLSETLDAEVLTDLELRVTAMQLDLLGNLPAFEPTP